MTLGLVLAFLAVHFIIGVVSWMGAWVSTETDNGLVAALDGTPLAPLVGAGSTFGGGLSDINPLSALSLAIDAMQFLLAMASFNYVLFEGGGVVGMFGTALGVVGHCIAAWLLFQFARAVAGSLGFGR